MTPAILSATATIPGTVDCTRWSADLFADQGPALLEWLKAQPRAQVAVRLPARQELRPLRQQIQSLGHQVTVRTPYYFTTVRVSR
ncbi:MAG: hypothetical protein KBC95_04995 [Candidatus Peribacteraceae bacterium]|nr:hypothetical protein [Candidatus Peribacteraceae bacterium]